MRAHLVVVPAPGLDHDLVDPLRGSTIAVLKQFDAEQLRGVAYMALKIDATEVATKQRRHQGVPSARRNHAPGQPGSESTWSGYVTDSLAVELELALAAEAIGDLLPGHRHVVERLCWDLATAHGGRKFAVER